MQIFLTDKDCKANLYPFTETRHTADIRVGIFTIKEKWELLTGNRIELISGSHTMSSDDVTVAADIIPTEASFQRIIDDSKNEYAPEESDEIKRLRYPWHIAQLNAWAIRKDFAWLSKNKNGTVADSNKVLNVENVFVGPGVKMELCILNASDGPIYIGPNAEIMEGSMIRGPVAICDNSVVKMGAKIYSGTTIGPNCIAGGEIKNSVMFANSNKAHDGYLGDSVLGEWCNLGAGTSNSNLKNNAADIIFNYDGTLVNAGNKVGLMMGDYSRAAINTSFNTGTIVGISCNIFGSGMPPRYVPNFTWGEQRYHLDKAIRDIENWKRLKNRSLDEAEKLKLTQVYNK